jgi:hypothetical protein
MQDYGRKEYERALEDAAQICDDGSWSNIRAMCEIRALKGKT